MSHASSSISVFPPVYEHSLYQPPILSWTWISSTNLYESGICTQELYTEIFAEPAWADVAIKLWRINSYNVLQLDYLLINTVINSLQRLSSSNFHRIQMHLNRPILYIGLVVKYKTILILKSKNLTCVLCSELIIKSKSSIIDILVSYVLYHTRWQKGIKSENLL